MKLVHSSMQDFRVVKTYFRYFSNPKIIVEYIDLSRGIRGGKPGQRVLKCGHINLLKSWGGFARF